MKFRVTNIETCFRDKPRPGKGKRSLIKLLDSSAFPFFLANARDKLNATDADFGRPPVSPWKCWSLWGCDWLFKGRKRK